MKPEWSPCIVDPWSRGVIPPVSGGSGSNLPSGNQSGRFSSGGRSYPSTRSIWRNMEVGFILFEYIFKSHLLSLLIISVSFEFNNITTSKYSTASMNVNCLLTLALWVTNPNVPGWTVFGDVHSKEKCFTKKYGTVLAKKCHSMSVYRVCKHLYLDNVSHLQPATQKSFSKPNTHYSILITYYLLLIKYLLLITY